MAFLTPPRINLGKRKSPGSNDNTPSGKRVVTDPTRLLLNEFGLQAGTINREFNARLDVAGLRREAQHRKALEDSAAEHERIRNDAARAQALLEQEIEQKRKQRETDEQRQLARQQRESEQQEIQQEVEAREEELKEAKRIQSLREAAAKTAREAAEVKAATLAAAAAEAANPPAAPASATATTNVPSIPTTTNTSTAQIIQQGAFSAPAQQPATASTTTRSTAAEGQTTGARAIHAKYIDVHKRLKKLRAAAGNITDKDLKRRTGDFRREIKKSVGQLTIDSKANQVPFKKIQAALTAAAALSQPTLDIREYIVQDLPSEVNQAQNTAGVVQTYLLNIFAKAVFAQLVNEAGASPQSAEPIGTIAVRIFSANEFRWQGVSLIDILLAKFHAKCPLLFGLTGATGSGEAMTGIGAGFAALSLRDFGKSALKNPFPPTNYWQSLAGLLNTPPDRIGEVHCILLKAMIENHAARFIRFFGQAAIVALRKAIVEVPKHAPKGAANSALSTLRVTLRRDLHLTL
jgi:nucleoporin GLE1